MAACPGALPERVRALSARATSSRAAVVYCLVSGGADSTCLWHVLRALTYRVSAVHVNHGLRGEESDEDALLQRHVLGAEILHPEWQSHMA